ncbi:hypothetical protein RB195_014778 [Necator americanus]|uniref:Uncharacterized protein n=1 Tax=Necator americanus TaxID=51031 RepID=A0ABR1E1K1_NECAM
MVIQSHPKHSQPPSRTQCESWNGTKWERRWPTAIPFALADDIVLITPTQPRKTNADRIRRNMWMHRSSAESPKDDAHAQRMGLGCPIRAQRNEHIRMHQLCLSGPGIEHDERPDPELGRRRRGAWGAYKSIEDVVKKTRNTRLRAHLVNTTVLPALIYASETWAFLKQEENAVSVIERAIERMLGVSRSSEVDGCPVRCSSSRENFQT